MSVSRGFFTFAQGEKYHRLAYALALSLKMSQSKYGFLTVGVDEEDIEIIPDKYMEVFDKVVPIKWGDADYKDSWKRKNEWKAVHMTPYQETIKLDSDMLFTTDISDWWDYMSNFDMLFTTDPVTYRQELITSDFYRKAFTANNLPNLYSAFYFFKKVEPVYNFARTSSMIFSNWETFYDKMLEPNTRPRHVSADVVFAIAAKLEGLEHTCVQRGQFPKFVHMKSALQNWATETDDLDWTTQIESFLASDGTLTIGNFKQTLPVHYVAKHFMTDSIITKMEKALGI